MAQYDHDGNFNRAGIAGHDVRSTVLSRLIMIVFEISYSDSYWSVDHQIRAVDIAKSCKMIDY